MSKAGSEPAHGIANLVAQPVEQLAQGRLPEQLNRAIDETITIEAETPLQKMRWFVLICIIVWLSAAMSLPIVIFLLTKNYLSFSLFSTLAPPIYLWYHFTKYLFPIDGLPINERRFELKRLKLISRQHRRE